MFLALGALALMPPCVGVPRLPPVLLLPLLPAVGFLYRGSGLLYGGGSGSCHELRGGGALELYIR